MLDGTPISHMGLVVSEKSDCLLETTEQDTVCLGVKERLLNITLMLALEFTACLAGFDSSWRIPMCQP